MSKIYEKMKDLIEKHNMIAEGSRVYAGVSGGADSVALLLLLQEYRKEKNFELKVVHVEHGIRGEESKNDAEFVVKLCERLKVPVKVYNVKVMAEVSRTGESTEEAARRLRYECFTKESGEDGVIAVAHHMEDQAETMLFNLVRGSYIKGLGGMSPVAGNLIRPLLKVSRQEIEDFLSEKNETFCVDITNGDVNYTRNRLRLSVIPELKKINSKAVEHICEAAENLRELDYELGCVTEEKYLKFVSCEGTGRVRVTISEESRDKRLIYLAITNACGRKKDICEEHILSVLKLFDLQVGKRVNLPYSLIAKRDYKDIVIYTENEAGNELFVPEVELKILSITELTEIPKSACIKAFDYDKIKGSACVRTPLDGDYFIIDKEGHKKLLKDYMVNEKIPSDQRKNVRVLADGSHIMWVVGKRISEYYKITGETKRVLLARTIEE